MVTLPGTEGDFGVLEGHSPLVSALRVGVIDVYESDMVTVSRRIMVSGGIVEVRPEACTALAEEAVPFESVKKEDIEAQIRKTRDVISIAQEAEKPALESRIDLLNKKLELLGN